MGRDVHEGREEGGGGKGWPPLSGEGGPPSEWYPVLCSRFLVQPVLSSPRQIFEHSGSMNPGSRGPSPPLPPPSSHLPFRGHWSGGQGSAHLRNDRHRRYPSAFGIPRFVNILAESLPPTGGPSKKLKIVPIR